MTTAHRPTFDPARGKDSLRGPAYHQRLLPAHKTLKHRQAGQGNEDENSRRDLRAELLQAEAAHFVKKGKTAPGAPSGSSAGASEGGKDRLAIQDSAARGEKRDMNDIEDEDLEDPEAKRRRLILEEAADIDRDSDGGSDEDDDDDEEDESEEEDEEAVLMRELEKIKKERAEQKAKEDAERAAKEEEKREVDIARGNPLLNPQSFGVKRRWDEDVVFKNQARGTEEKGKSKEFVNDLLRSDFHKRFMGRYVR